MLARCLVSAAQKQSAEPTKPRAFEDRLHMLMLGSAPLVISWPQNMNLGSASRWSFQKQALTISKSKRWPSLPAFQPAIPGSLRVGTGCFTLNKFSTPSAPRLLARPFYRTVAGAGETTRPTIPHRTHWAPAATNKTWFCWLMPLQFESRKSQSGVSLVALDPGLIASCPLASCYGEHREQWGPQGVLRNGWGGAGPGAAGHPGERAAGGRDKRAPPGLGGRGGCPRAQRLRSGLRGGAGWERVGSSRPP